MSEAFTVLMYAGAFALAAIGLRQLGIFIDFSKD